MNRFIKQHMSIIAGTLVFLFAAHAYGYVNLCFSAGGVMMDVANARASYIAQGHFLRPVLFALRGTLSAQLLIGLLCAVFMIAANILLCRLLDIRCAVCRFLACGLTCAHWALTALNAASLNIADACVLALMLAIAGVYAAMRLRFGVIWSIPVLTAAFALDRSAALCAVMLIPMAMLAQALDGKPVLRTAIKPVISLAASLLLHGMAMLVLCGVSPLPPLQPHLAFPALYTHLPQVCAPLLTLLLASGAAAAMYALGKEKRVLTGAALLVCIALAALLPGMLFSPESRCTFYLALPCLLPLMTARHIRLRRAFAIAGALAVGFVIMCSIVFANQVYLKRNLDFDNTFSLMTRVIDRAEQTEGYVPMETPVAILGTPDKSPLNIPRRGFTHLERFDAARGSFSIVSEDDYPWYIWQVMGYTFNLTSNYDRAQLAEREDVRAIPAFPAAGCCQMIDGTLVIRISH